MKVVALVTLCFVLVASGFVMGYLVHQPHGLTKLEVVRDYCKRSLGMSASKRSIDICVIKVTG